MPIKPINNPIDIKIFIRLELLNPIVFKIAISLFFSFTKIIKPEIEERIAGNDLVLITADHGCDPTWVGSDHTREHVPVLFVGNKIKQQYIGERSSFADMGQTIAKHLNLKNLAHGIACNL